MNPALPAGGSALDALTARQGEAPTGLTTFGLSFQWASFNKQLSGSDSVETSGTERLDALLFDISAWRHFKGGFAAGIQVPIGSVRVKPSGGTAANVAGFGDLQLGGAYTFNGPWGKVFRPRIRLRSTLVLPTGRARRVEDTSPGVPPNLIAIGTGALGVGFDGNITQPVHQHVSVRAWTGFRAPLTFSETENRFGWSLSAGVGALYQPKQKWLASLGLSVLYRDRTRSRESGDLVNSGGNSLSADAGVTYLATDQIAIGMNANLPVYQNVNGTQIGQSFGLMSFVGFSFGEGEHEHGPEHANHSDSGEADAHDHGSEDAHDRSEPDRGRDSHDSHDGGADAHDSHDGGADAHDHGGRADSHDSGTDNDHHNKAEHKHADGKDAGKQDRKGHSHSNDASNDAKVQPNVGILASGGASFSLASAVVPGKVVAIDFWAEWCKPCKGIEATLVAHASTHPKLAVRKVEVPTPRSNVGAEHFGGKVKLPTVWFVNDRGVVLEKLEGVTQAQLKSALKRYAH